MSGNPVAQFITVGSAPIVTRLFTPEDFGVFALFTAVVGICAKVGTLCYERAILLPKDPGTAHSVIKLSVIVLVLLALAVGIGSWLFGNDLSTLLGSSELSFWLLLVPCGLVLAGTVNILRYWALRETKFRLISAVRITEAGGAAAFKIGAGFLLGSWAGGLIVGSLAGYAVALALMMRYLWPGLPRNWRKDLRQQVSTVAYEYRQFPQFASINALLNVVSRYLIVFFLSSFFGTAVVGFYNLAHRMLAQPIDTLSNSISNVYFQKSASQVADRHSLIPGLRKITVALFLLALVPFAVLFAYGKPIITFVFGPQWETAGVFSEIMAPWFLCLFCIGPSAMVFEVCRRQQVKLWINVSTALVSVLVLWRFYSMGRPIEEVIGAFVVGNIVLSVVQVVMAFQVAARPGRGWPL